jgi:uncharacterized protein involved in exopolysaccharide biosynthesis
MPSLRSRRRHVSYLLEAPLRRPLLVVAPLIVAALAAFAAGLLLPPRYRSSALLQAEWEEKDEALLRERGIDVVARRSQAVRQRATGRALLERVVHTAKPFAGAGQPAAAPGAQVDRVLSDLRVRPMASSAFVVEFVHGDPAKAALVPNTIARLLVEETDPAGVESSRQALEARLDEARRVLKERAEALARVAPKTGAASADDTEAAAPDEERLAESRAVAASLATARTRADRLRQAVLAGGRDDVPSSPEAQLQELRGELADLRKRYTDAHPDVEKLKGQILRLEASLRATAPASRSPQQELRETEAEIEELLLRQAQLEKGAPPPVPAAPRRSAAASTPDSQRERLIAERDQAQKAYQDVLREWQSAETAGQLRRGPIARFELLRAAEVPRAPESPDPWLFTLAGAIVGLLMGVIAALVAELRDRSVKGPEDLEQILPVPLLATLPEVRKRDRG